MEYFLSLSYQDLLNYCQSSVEANRLCLNERFWDKKALQDLNQSITTITGQTPAQRYGILSQILGSYSPLDTAISRGQTNFIRNIWTSNYEFSGISLWEAARTGHLDTVSAVYDLFISSGADPTTINTYFQEAYDTTLEEGPLQLLDFFEQFFTPNYISSLGRIIATYELERPDLIDLVIQRAKARGLPNIVQLFTLDLLEDEYIPNIEFMLERYPQEINARELYELALEDCPTAKFFSQYLQL